MGGASQKSSKNPKDTIRLGFIYYLTALGKWWRGEETKEMGFGLPQMVNCEKVHTYVYIR